MEKKFTHIDQSGDPNMVDVSGKQVSKRSATARSIVVLNDEIMEHLAGEDIITKKGSVFQTAILAGIMASKKTGELIPLCHPLALEKCDVKIQISNTNEVVIYCTASITAKTGVEMEALTGASVTALTIYDMCKSISKTMQIGEIKLVEKIGGKSDFRNG